MKLQVKSNATNIPRESTPYITLFKARSRIFLPTAILLVALSWPPRPASGSLLGLLVGNKKMKKEEIGNTVNNNNPQAGEREGGGNDFAGDPTELMTRERRKNY